MYLAWTIEGPKDFQVSGVESTGDSEATMVQGLLLCLYGTIQESLAVSKRLSCFQSRQVSIPYIRDYSAVRKALREIFFFGNYRSSFFCCVMKFVFGLLLFCCAVLGGKPFGQHNEFKEASCEVLDTLPGLKFLLFQTLYGSLSFFCKCATLIQTFSGSLEGPFSTCCCFPLFFYFFFFSSSPFLL